MKSVSKPWLFYEEDGDGFATKVYRDPAYATRIGFTESDPQLFVCPSILHGVFLSRSLQEKNLGSMKHAIFGRFTEKCLLSLFTPPIHEPIPTQTPTKLRFYKRNSGDPLITLWVARYAIEGTFLGWRKANLEQVWAVCR